MVMKHGDIFKYYHPQASQKLVGFFKAAKQRSIWHKGSDAYFWGEFSVISQQFPNEISLGGLQAEMEGGPARAIGQQSAAECPVPWTLPAILPDVG